VLSILSGDFALDLTLRCGTLENEHAPVFTLIGVQSLQTLTVNASGQELQVGWLSWSRRMGLAPVEYRVPNGLSGCAPGQTREITVKGPLSDVRLLDHAGAALQGDGPGVGSAWAFLFDSRVLPVPLVGIVSVAYLALLAIPFGFWARRSWATIAGIVLLGVVVAVAPDAFRARPVSGAECAGLTAGAILGAIIRPRTTPSGASSS
jgi:hypothetical protein